MKRHLKAFRVLLNELILIDPIEEFPRKTIAEISAIIQRQFISLFEGTQNAAKNVLREISLIDGGGEILKTIKLGEPVETEDFSFQKTIQSQPSDSEFFKLCVAYQCVGFGYSKWGFTPKLAARDQIVCVLANCFGKALLLGSFCRARGMKVELGIAPDHPHVIVHFDDGAYTVDEIGSIVKLIGNFEEHDGYKLYRPLTDERILAKVLLVSSFDEAIVYEILENMETLRRISLGIHEDFLPETYKESMELANRNATLLQQVNWKELQAYLFPALTSAVIAHAEEWEEEINRVAKKRLEHYHDMILEMIMKTAFQKTACKTDNFCTVHWAFLEEASQYRDEVIMFMREGIMIPETVPQGVRTYFESYKESLLYGVKEKPELTQLFEYGCWSVEVVFLPEIQKMIEKLKTKKEEQPC